MNLPHWVKKARLGGLTCLFCGSLVVQIGQNWICSDKMCKKHDDLPAGESYGFSGWNEPINVISASGTVASGVSLSTTTTI